MHRIVTVLKALSWARVQKRPQLLICKNTRVSKVTGGLWKRNHQIVHSRPPTAVFLSRKAGPENTLLLLVKVFYHKLPDRNISLCPTCCESFVMLRCQWRQQQSVPRGPERGHHFGQGISWAGMCTCNAWLPGLNSCSWDAEECSLLT